MKEFFQEDSPSDRLLSCGEPMKTSKFYKLIIQNAFLYMAFYCLFYISAKEKMPADWLLGTTIILSILFLVGYAICSKISGCIFWFALLLYQLTGSFYLKNKIFDATGDIFGLYQGDGLFYWSFGINATKTAWSSLESFAVDDCGFPAVMKGLFWWKGNPEQYFFLLIIANGICVVLSSFILYRMAKKLLDEQNAKIVAMIWGLSTYAMFSTVQWLKENFFAVFIVLALYCLLDTCENRRKQKWV